MGEWRMRSAARAARTHNLLLRVRVGLEHDLDQAQILEQFRDLGREIGHTRAPTSFHCPRELIHALHEARQLLQRQRHAASNEVSF